MTSSLTSIGSQNPEHTALVAETSLTFSEVRLQAAAIGHALRESGLQTGDSVAIVTEHRASFYCCFAGCFAASFPAVVLDPFAATDELVLMLRTAAPAAIIADESTLRRIVEHADAALPAVVVRVGRQEKTTKGSGWLSAWRRNKPLAANWRSLADLPAGEADSVSVSDDDKLPAYVMFTSGTTSKPKATVVSRAALRYHIDTLSRVFGYRSGSKLLSYLPTHHTDGLVHSVAASLLTGMTVVQPGPFDQSVDLEQALRANNISHFLTVPTMLAIIKRTFGDRPGLFQFEDFSTLISTAGYLDESLWKEFQEFYRVRVSNFYGMTETVSGTLYCGPDDKTYRFGTLGKPVDADVRIVDESGATVTANAVGELQISGRHLMTGYLGDPDATRATITDGWLSTGDLFTRDDDGFFHFVGRRKNIIKRGGVTVYPEDIQRVVSAMPGIREVEVVGLPDPMFEEVIVICAVVDASVSTGDIRDICQERLSPERRPDRIELLDGLPRGPSGKVQRDALIAVLGERKAVKQESPGSLRDQIIGLAAETFSVEVRGLDETSSPETVDNWDSYAGMEFVLALEKAFSLRLGPRAIMQMNSIGQAIEIISAEIDAAGGKK